MPMNESHLSFAVIKNVADRSQLGDVSQEIVRCITQSFGQEMPSDEVDDALKGEFIIIAKTVDNMVVGFATIVRHTAGDFKHRKLVEYEPDTLRYSFHAGTVDRNYQGQGVYKELNRQRLGYAVENKAAIISTTTQNPRVEHGITQVLDELVLLGKLKSYTKERILLPALFTRRLTKYQLETKDTPFEDLNLDVGDAFAIVFHLEYSSRIDIIW